jgi:hypothetical protein
MIDKLEKVLARLVDKNKALYSKIFLSDDEELKSLLTDLYEESRSVGYDDGYWRWSSICN